MTFIELSDDQKATIISEVEAQTRGVISAGMGLNTDEFLGFFSEDEFVSVNSGGIYFATRSAWADSVANWHAFIEKRSYGSTEVRVTPLTADLAMNTASTVVEDLMKNGEQLRLNVVTTGIWKKGPGGWKMIHAHESWHAISAE